MSVNQKIWVLVAILVFITAWISVGTLSTQSQQGTGKSLPHTTPDQAKYPVADLNTPEIRDADERNDRTLKNSRYDKYAMVLLSPGPYDTFVRISDGEPHPEAIPLKESRLVAIGNVLDSKASVSNDKSGVYSEYSLQIQSILKNDNAKERRVGETISFDRSGGFVRYPNGQKILYLNDWQDLPEINGRYVVFLDNKGNGKSPNYRLITAYKLQDEQVIPLDRTEIFAKFRGMTEKDFVKRLTVIDN